MTRLYLLRHGETQSNIEQRYQGQGNSPLSELGIEESTELSKALQSEPIKAFYSSDLTRAHETAKIVAEPHGLQVKKLPGMKERFYGEWENLTFDEIKKKYPEIYETWLMDPAKAKIPGSETLEELQSRGVETIESTIKNHDGETICIVGHGGINRMILFHYMNLDLNNFWRIRQDNCCLNIIEFKNIPIVHLLNSTWFVGEKRMSGSGYY
jgi:alpha-ribazole phosphatase/probable phosphoglycerate mutase